MDNTSPTPDKAGGSSPEKAASPSANEKKEAGKTSTSEKTAVKSATAATPSSPEANGKKSTVNPTARKHSGLGLKLAVLLVIIAFVFMILPPDKLYRMLPASTQQELIRLFGSRPDDTSLSSPSPATLATEEVTTTGEDGPKVSLNSLASAIYDLQVESTSTDARLKQLATQVGEIERQLAEWREQSALTTPSSVNGDTSVPATSGITEEGAKQAAKETVEQALNDVIPTLEQQVSQLRRQLESMKTQQQQSRMIYSDLVQTLLLWEQIRQHIENGTSYTPKLELFERSAQTIHGTEEILAVLRMYADSPPPSRIQLQQQMKELVADYYQKQSDSEAPQGAWEKVKQLVSANITLRKVGENTQGSDVESILARAEALAEKGELQLAARELKPVMEGSEAINSWVGNVEARHELEKSSNDFTSLLNTLLLREEYPKAQPSVAPLSESNSSEDAAPVKVPAPDVPSAPVPATPKETVPSGQAPASEIPAPAPSKSTLTPAPVPAPPSAPQSSPVVPTPPATDAPSTPVPTPPSSGNGDDSTDS